MSMVRLPGLQEMIDSISRERNLPKPSVEAALREALLKGYERYRRTQGIDQRLVFDETYFDNFEVELDTDDEGFRVLSTKNIVEDVSNPDHEISLREVQEVAAEAQLGDTVILDVTPEQKDFGRMAAIQTKQVLAQKLRDQQRKLIQEEFQDLEGTVLQARVLRFERQSVIVAVTSGYGQSEVEAELMRREQLPNDNYRANATIKVYLKRVCEGTQRGPQLQVSRADAGLVVYLFANEVPEIEDDIVRIVAVAREANPPSRHVGPRTKIAVDTLERDVDPVGACIGARGSRIQVVVNELRGEKIDVIRWSPDPTIYIANALSPARVDEVRLMNHEDRQAHVLVPADQLSLAIGKEGQNVRLAARLTGWKIDIRDTAKYDFVAEDEAAMAIAAQHEARRAAIAAELAAEEEAHQAADEWSDDMDDVASWTEGDSDDATTIPEDRDPDSASDAPESKTNANQSADHLGDDEDLDDEDLDDEDLDDEDLDDEDLDDEDLDDEDLDDEDLDDEDLDDEDLEDEDLDDEDLDGEDLDDEDLDDEDLDDADLDDEDLDDADLDDKGE